MVELQHYVELEDMVHTAIKVNSQIKRKGLQSSHNSGSSTSWKPNAKKDEGDAIQFKTEPPKRRDEVPNANNGKIDFPNCNHDIMCFKCLGICDIASQYPNKRTMIARVDGR